MLLVVQLALGVRGSADIHGDVATLGTVSSEGDVDVSILVRSFQVAACASGVGKALVEVSERQEREYSSRPSGIRRGQEIGSSGIVETSPSGNVGEDLIAGYRVRMTGMAGLPGS